MSRSITFTVDGEPATKGSYRAFTIRRADGSTGARVENDNKRCGPWQTAIGWAARAAMQGQPPMSGQVRLTASFYFARPKTSKLAAPRQDLDKLQRALFDALTGIAYVDDAQVASVMAAKWWADDGKPGVLVTITEGPA